MLYGYGDRHSRKPCPGAYVHNIAALERVRGYGGRDGEGIKKVALLKFCSVVSRGKSGCGIALGDQMPVTLERVHLPMPERDPE